MGKVIGSAKRAFVKVFLHTQIYSVSAGRHQFHNHIRVASLFFPHDPALTFPIAVCLVMGTAVVSREA